jgi:hypothetical protein
LKSAVWAHGIVKDGTLKAEATRLQRLLCESEEFWLNVNDIKAVLSPLADGITAIEGNEVNSRR